jgi:hypothetical protein
LSILLVIFVKNIQECIPFGHLKTGKRDRYFN